MALVKKLGQDCCQWLSQTPGHFFLNAFAYLNRSERQQNEVFLVADRLAMMIFVLSVGLSFRNDEQNLWVACKTFTMMNKVMVFRKS
jgi:hypothetical protein